MPQLTSLKGLLGDGAEREKSGGGTCKDTPRAEEMELVIIG